jgi:Ca2+-binding RTX toxin-like protein
VVVAALLGALAVPLFGPAAAGAAVMCDGRPATLVGSDDADILNGTPGVDVMAGLGGADTIKGVGGDDHICGGPGADTILGGPGSDWVAFDDAARGGLVDLEAHTADLDGTDQLSSIENARGGPGPDVVRGDGLRNHLIIGDQDSVEGRGGDDVLATTLADAAGSMTLSYESAPGPVRVDGIAFTVAGAAGVDELDFTPTTIIGGAFADRLSCSDLVDSCYLDGGRGSDVLTGGRGTDTLWGGPGDDRLVGRDGADTASFTGTSPVAVNLTSGVATGQGRDTLVRITGAVGSSAADVMVGSTLAGCSLQGGAGDDRLSSSTVACTLSGGPGDDALAGGPAADVIRPDDAGDVGDDDVTAGGGNDIVWGDEGDDALSGGTGVDRLSYGATPGPIVADLVTGVVTGAGTDAVRSFENLDGSHGADNLRGTSGRNVIDGQGGDDMIYGGDGPDVLYGGDGADTVDGEAGEDRVSGDRGYDSLFGGTERDTVFFRYGYPSVNADMVTALAISSGSGIDFFVEFEDVFGTAGNDILRGNTGPNFLEGSDGIDVCEGRGGADIRYHCEG